MNNLDERKVITLQQVFNLINSLVGQDHILTIPRVFIDYTGDIPSALLLSQLIYWSSRTTRTDGYIWKTYSDWEQELSLNSYRANKAAKHLKTMGVLRTVVRKAGGNPTVHYLLKQDDFLKSFMQFLNNRKSSISTNENLNIKRTSNRDYPQRLRSTIEPDKSNIPTETGSHSSLRKRFGNDERETRYAREGIPELIQSEVTDGK